MHPKRHLPNREWEHYKLWEGVKKAIDLIPKNFKSSITVSGIRATEIYTFSGILSATVESEVVRTLTDMRGIWDPKSKYSSYVFTRQSETFPDVLLKGSSGDTILGIELKSWYLLAKEGEPSFRFTVTPKACAPQDLLVVVPWVLSNILSGSPTIHKPFIKSAYYISEYRNYWWQHVREARGNTGIEQPKDAHPYPKRGDEIVDNPLEDRGNNFGRIARIEIMDEYARSFDDISLLGIKLRYWREFFKSEGKKYEDICKQSKLPFLFF